MRCPSVTPSFRVRCSSASIAWSVSMWRRSRAPRYDRAFRMKSDGIAFGIAGILFGLIAGWIIGSQYESARRQPPSATQAAASAPAAAQQQAAPPLDEAKVTAFRSAAEKEPKNPAPRAQLGDLYFNSERFDDSIKWYEQALALTPNDVRV